LLGTIPVNSLYGAGCREINADYPGRVTLETITVDNWQAVPCHNRDGRIPRVAMKDIHMGCSFQEET
jgi:hypothetical protein